MASSPDAMNSSSPTLATPNHGRTSRAMRAAATRSSTSRAIASLSRKSLSPFPSLMGRSSQVSHVCHPMAPAPAFELVHHSQRRPGFEERSRADLDGVGSGHEQLDGVLAGAVTAGEWANMSLRPSMFGQLRFTSTAVSRDATSDSMAAALA